MKLHSKVLVLISLADYMLVQVKASSPSDTITTTFWSSTPCLKRQESQSTNGSTWDVCAPQAYMHVNQHTCQFVGTVFRQAPAVREE